MPPIWQVLNSLATGPTTSEPVIIEASGDTSGENFFCEAIGNPVPAITWTAEDQRNGNRITLNNNMMGITIEMAIENSEATSELRISRNAPFHSPVCIATNMNGIDTSDVISSGKKTRGEKYTKFVHTYIHSYIHRS